MGMAEKTERTEAPHAQVAGAGETTGTGTEAITGPTASRRNDSTSLAAGEVLGNRFKVIRLVARGGMGEVYEAVDLALGARMAIKTVRTGGEIGQDQLTRLKREVLLARQITHPNVCRIFEFFETTSRSGADLTFLTMEYLEGETLAARLRRAGPMQAAEALELLREMAEGLGAIHAQGIVHRDFKSSNVMLVSGTEGRRAVVMDFGIARQQLERETALTQEGVVVGTPDYMAPEQRRGEEASVRSDVYAFGAVACELVTGQVPQGGVATGAGRRWKPVLARALAPDPGRRFATAEAVVAALETMSSRARAMLVMAVAVLTLVGVAWRAEGPRAAIIRAFHRTETLGSVTPRDPELGQLYSRGRELNRKLRWVEAVPVLQEVVRRQPSLVPAALDLADALAAAGHWQESMDTAQDALRRAAGLPEGVRLAAEARYWKAMGDKQHARDITKRVHELELRNDEATLAYLGFLDSGPALELIDRLREAQSAVLQDPRFDHLEAKAAAEESKPGRAFEALARASQKTSGPDDRFLQVKTSALQAYVALREGKFPDAILPATTIAEFYEREGYRFEEAAVITGKGLALWMSGARNEATAEAFRSLEMRKEFGPSPELVSSSGFWGVVFAVNGPLSLARKALGLVEGFPQLLLRGSPEFLFASGLVAREEGDLPRAAAMVDAALLGYTPPPTGWIAVKGIIASDQDRLDELEQNIEGWLRQGRKELGPEERALLALARADVKLARNRPAEAAALLRTVAARDAERWRDSYLLTESEIARLRGRPQAAVKLATEALREAAHEYGSNGYRATRLQLARAYQAAGEPAQAAALLDALEAEARREDRKAFELEVRLVRWEGSPTGHSPHHQELKQLEADATRMGFLQIARHAREAAAR